MRVRDGDGGHERVRETQHGLGRDRLRAGDRVVELVRSAVVVFDREVLREENGRVQIMQGLA